MLVAAVSVIVEELGWWLLVSLISVDEACGQRCNVLLGGEHTSQNLSTLITYIGHPHPAAPHMTVVLGLRMST